MRRNALLVSISTLCLLAGPAIAAPAAKECERDVPFEAPAVLGTVRSGLNDHGQLVLALDRSLSEARPPDGKADLVFLFHPRNREDLGSLLAATSKPVTNATVEHQGDAVRVTVPGHRSWVLGMPGAEAAGSFGTYIDGLAISRVDRGIRAVGLNETLEAYRGFDLVQGPGGG